MKTKILQYTLVLSCVFLLCLEKQTSIFDPQEQLSGGEATVFSQTRNAFSLPIRKLDFEDRMKFEIGDSLFNKAWVTAPASTTARDGLGPLFNARSCSGCHSKDGRGRPPIGAEQATSILFRLSIPGTDDHGGPKPDPVYGGQLNGKAIHGIAFEGKETFEYQMITGEFADKELYELRKPIYTIENLQYGNLHKGIMISPRVAPMIPGLGLLEAVSEETILSFADPEDKNGDGISGRPNYVWDVVNHKKTLGRFGWKANQPSLMQQNAGAFVGDMGITSPLFPEENHTKLQEQCKNTLSGGSPEISQENLEHVTFYTQHLGVPARRNWNDPVVRLGKKIFFQAKCDACHVPKMTTGYRAGDKKLSHQIIFPYTDLLLHDMGKDLADGRPDYEATGSEWRTAPLWGIGLIEKVNGHTFLLHDGRARNLQEAILWHGGEAEQSKQAFINLPKKYRLALIEFLKSL